MHRSCHQTQILTRESIQSTSCQSPSDSKPVEILAMARKAPIGLPEIDCPMAGDTKAAGLVTVGLTHDMDPRDKHEDDNRACVCCCAPRLTSLPPTYLFPSA